MTDKQDLIARLHDEADLCANDGADDIARLLREAAAEIDRRNGIGGELIIARRERDEARAELERERMRLAACGVVALADTPESAAKARDMHPDYKSASCDDVARRVDECMALRAEVARLRADAVPEGWKLVPVEPTERMLAELFRGYTTRREAYGAMLAAAPAKEDT